MALLHISVIDAPFFDRCRRQYDALTNDLSDISQQQNTALERWAHSVQQCLQALQQLVADAANEVFADKSHAIDFYKNVKPTFHAQLLYYQALFQLELDRPPGDREQLREYFGQALGRTTQFFSDNKFIYQYLRTGSTHLDESLFAHYAPDHAIAMRLHSLTEEPLFPTRYDLLVAKVKANDQLATHLHRELEDLQTGTSAFHPDLHWTASKVGAVELVYALYAAGVFNNGKAELREIVEHFQTVFQINLGNYARIMQEILYRKSGHAVFTDHLKNELLLYIQRIEERRVR